MDTSKRSHEAPTTFSVVSCNGVLMSEVQEPITMLRLTATRFFPAFIRAKWQTRLRRNEYLRLWDCGDGGISRNAVSILCLSIDWLAILTAAKTKSIFILVRNSNMHGDLYYGVLFVLRDKFVVRRLLKTFRKNRNCSLAPESIHLAAVSHTADGCVNNIKSASYLTENLPLTCKRIPKRQRPSNTRTIFHVIHLKAWIRDSRKEKPYTS